MTPKPDPNAAPPERLSLSRWSRRKLDAARTEQAPSAVAQSVPATGRSDVPGPGAATEAPSTPAAQLARSELPPIDSLTPESDFTGFFQPQGEVDEALKRAALKQLLRDPRFNVMDGLDIYVGDYTKSDPIPGRGAEAAGAGACDLQSAEDHGERGRSCRRRSARR